MNAAPFLFCFGLAVASSLRAIENDPVRLQFRPTPTGLELSWQSAQPLTAPAEFRVEASEDLVGWETRARVILEKDRTLSWKAEFENSSPKTFFRVASHFGVSLVREQGAELLGYDDQFKQHLARIGQITPEEFAARYPSPTLHLPNISWDPTEAAFFEEYNTSPSESYLPDFTLNEAELASFKQHGFVVTTRLEQDKTTTFCDYYYHIFVRDLPVYVTADSILHAWHRSFSVILEQTEDAFLYSLLEQILDGMAAALPQLAAELNQPTWSASLNDADLYLTVARSLLTGTSTPGHFGIDDLVSKTLDAIADEKTVPFNLFGRLERDPSYRFDFSQFKVRAHYVNSARLQRYFKAMMWCGRVDLRVAGNPGESFPWELGTALLLSELLARSGQLENWAILDKVIGTYIGPKDCMDPLQMANIRELAGVDSLSDISSPAGLDEVREAVEAGRFGIQEILGDTYWSPFGPEQVWLPRSFGLLGQRFTVDSWALGKVVFDRILWDEDGIPDLSDKVRRRRASGLDVAFSVFGNNTPVPQIIGRIQHTSGHPFRDGLPYQHNLAAVRETVDDQAEGTWHSSTYYQWLHALRALSPRTTGTELPESMRTPSWNLRLLNTQLASWTELRHDTVLYAKQTYIPPILCFYPAGFVEPIPAFWNRMSTMASQTARMVQDLPMTGIVPWQGRYGDAIGEVDLAVIKSNQVQFLSRFASVTHTLQGMAEKELAEEPFSAEETAFLENLVEDVWVYWGTRTYSGWYPSLFYRSNEGKDPVTPPPSSSHDSEKPPFVVTDIMTAATDSVSGDPGAVIHEAVGTTAFMLVAVDNGPDRMVFGGPVYTYREFERPIDDRLTDADWEAMVRNNEEPPLPEWTHGWLLAP